MNKFLILMVALVCIFKFSNAQTEKGNQTLGFNVSYANSRYDDNFFDNANSSTSFNKVKNTSFTLGPVYSYFIADKIDVGASFSLNNFSNNTNPIDKSVPGNKYSNKSYDAIVYARKYFLYANKIGVRTGPFVGYTWASQEYGPSNVIANSYTSDNKSHGYEAGAKLEAVYFPSKHLGISAMIANLEYEHFTGRTISSNSYNIEKTSGNNINFNFINSGLGLSFFYVFDK